MSGGSSSSQSARRRVLGVPKWCWCGERVSTLISKSEYNLYRRYFRCSYAVSAKIWGDDHLFKWVDEELIEEVEMLRKNNRKQRFEEIFSEVKDIVKKTEVQVVIGCIAFGLFIKVLG